MVLPETALGKECTDFESELGSFDDNLLEGAYELIVDELNDEAKTVTFFVEGSVGDESLRNVFLRLSGDGEMPTVIPLSLESMPDGRFKTEYWILNSDFERSGLMPRYEIWRTEPAGTCLAMRRMYYVPMPANNTLRH